MEKVFNKLVRDNIPDIIKNNGDESFTRILSNEEYSMELLKKLIEEAKEVNAARNKDELTEELADLFEVINSILLLNNISLEDVENIRKEKFKKRGGFENKIFLIKTISKD